MRERWAMIGHFVVLFWFFPFSTIYFLPDLPGKTTFELCLVWGRGWEGWGVEVLYLNGWTSRLL